MRPGAALLCFVLSTRAAAAATDRQSAASLAQRAQALYNEGKYGEAATLLEQALPLDSDPRLIFNLARAYDQAGEVQAALDLYRRFLAKAPTDPELTKRAKMGVDRLKAVLEHSRDRPEKAGPQSAAPQPNPRELALFEKEELAARQRLAVTPAPAPTGWAPAAVLTATSIVALGGAIVLAVLAQNPPPEAATGRWIGAGACAGVTVGAAIAAVLLAPRPGPYASVSPAETP